MNREQHRERGLRQQLEVSAIFFRAMQSPMLPCLQVLMSLFVYSCLAAGLHKLKSRPDRMQTLRLLHV